jgi:prefoldin subunit 5
MINKNSKPDIKLDSLLNTYSINDINNLFAQIDEKISLLHDRSAKDFKQLNDSFKEIYSQSNRIAENVSDTCKAFDNENNNSIYQVTNTIYESLKAQYEIFDYKILVVLRQCEKLSNQIRHIIFPIKNFSQSLMSIKYLSANIKVAFSYINNNDWKELERINTKAESIVDSLKDATEKLYKLLNQLIKKSNKSFEELRQIKDKGEINFPGLLVEIKSGLIIIEKKYEENRSVIPHIKNNIEDLDTNNTEIIKKLQYHDIIRQKMEHIQQAHKDLIYDLKEFSDDNPEKHVLSKKAKYYMRIRDISGLQAAQLIHVTREYQSAIEVITDSFNSIGDNVKEITTKFENVYTFDKLSYKRMFQKISSYINTADKYLNDSKNQNEILDEKINTLNNSLLSLDQHTNSFTNKWESLNNILGEYSDCIDRLIDKEPELNKLNVQFVSLINETKDSAGKLFSLFEYLLTSKSNIEGFANKTEIGLIGEINFSEFKNLLSKFKKSGTQTGKTIRKNNDDSSSVLQDIKNSISKIKYYDYFENVIQEIISELNSVNYKLEVADDSFDNSKEENLEHLKEYYTMQSEYDVHEKITKGENLDLDIVEDDEVEFF